MTTSTPILKIGAAVLENGRVLLVRKRGLSVLILPGGKPENGETDREALSREIDEELGCSLVPGSVDFYGEFSDVLPDASRRLVNVRLYSAELEGTPEPRAEIEELVWWGTGTSGMPLAPSLANGIIPHLVATGLVT